MLFMLTIYGITAVLLALIAIGIFLIVVSMRTAHAERKAIEGDPGPLTPLERVRRYEGPISKDMVPYNPVWRVFVELVSGTCGFPGLGWLMSGHVAVGLVLMSIVPSFVWALYPAWVVRTGAFRADAFAAVRYLPYLGAGSALALAVREALPFRREQADRDVQA